LKKGKVLAQRTIPELESKEELVLRATNNLVGQRGKL